jgi:Ca-activated chloride channel family protein
VSNLNFSNDPGFAFSSPGLLLLLVIIPVLSWLKGKAGRSSSVVFSSTAPLRALGRRRESKAGTFLSSLFLLSLAPLIIALARPQQGKTLTHSEASGIDIMLLLDVSRSMLAEDFSIGSRRANRLDAVKKVTEIFIKDRPNDRIGIIAFAGRPYLVSPLTLDHDWLFQNLERVRIGLVEDGTAIGSALASGANRLKDRDAKSRVLVVITDGDSNAGKVTPATAAEAAAALGMKIYSIGTGTHGMAPYPVTDAWGRTFYRDFQVEIDEETLKQIAQIGGGKYYRATDTKSLEQIYEDIDKLEKTTVELTQLRQYRDLFPWFIGIGAGMLSLQMILGQTLWKKIP